MAAYDVYGVFERIPQLLGMELTRRGRDRWEGGYYINGDRHPSRHEKLKVVKWNNGIWIHEEGSESCSLTQWLERYGGAADYNEAVAILRGLHSPISYEHGAERERAKEEVKLVPTDVLEGARAYDLGKCPLFVWMCRLFGTEAVRAAWEKYNVTTDAKGNAVFWSVDKDGRILHDKRMAYKGDGHRNRDFGAWRKYTMGKGYTGKCLFGEHLMGDAEKVYCCESEKTALLFYLYYGRVCVATGGKNALNFSDERLVLIPDMDGREEWARRGFVWQWWNKFTNVQDHDDIGDAIVRRIMDTYGEIDIK